MALGLRIINVLAILFFIICGIFGNPSGGRTAANLAGIWFGLALLSVPLGLSIWAIGGKCSSSRLRNAKTAHLIAQIFIACLAVFIAATGSSVKAGAMVALFGLPYLLNFIVLHKMAAARRTNKKARLKIEPTLIDSSEAAPQLSSAAPENNPTFAADAFLRNKASSPTQPSRNYFLRHWQGDLSLGVSYWVNGGLISSGIGYVVIMIVTLLAESMTMPLRQSSYLYIIMVTATILLWVWSIVGIWRSARMHPARGGSKGWATAARVMVVIGILSVSANMITTIGPQMSEFVQIAVGKDPLGRLDVKLSQDKRSIILKGAFGEGSAQAVAEMLNVSPQVKAVVLESGGGRLREAEQIAQLVRARKLDTYIEKQCESACTFVFLAGVERAATPNAQLGFHQPSFVALDPASQQRMTNQMLANYRKANLPDAFVNKIGNTPPDQMWYPEREELVLAGVITRISLGGESSLSGLSRMNSLSEIKLAMRSEAFWRAVEARFPNKVDEIAALAWETRQKGGNDSEIANAIRSGMSGIFDTLLSEVDGPMLEKFAQLSIDQMIAANAISPQACGLLLDSKLNVAHTLPKELAEREIQFFKDALAAPAQTVNVGLQESLDQGFQVVFDSMPPEDVEVFHRFMEHDNEPGKQCKAMISFYRSVLKTDAATRHRMLKEIFRS